MLGAYNIDSDEEEEEEVSTNVPKSASTHIQELEKVSYRSWNCNLAIKYFFCVLF